MRRQRIPLAVIVFTLLVGALIANAQLGGTSGVRVPYSGFLEKDGVPITGQMDLTFDVFNDDAGSAACTTAGPLQVAVIAGRFAVVLGPIDQNCIANRDVYVGVTLDDGSGPLTLPGRQRIFPAVAAMSSGSGDFAYGTSQLVTANGGMELGQAGQMPFIDFHGQGGVGGADYDVRLIHDGASQLTLQGNMNVPAGNLSFGHQVKQQINLWGTEYGIGVQNGTTYFRSDSNFAWFHGGVHADGQFDPGGGSTLATLDGAGTFNVAGDVNVAGDLNHGCPVGMVDVGAYCIQPDLTVGVNTTWYDTNNACQTAGFRLCTAAEVSGAVRRGQVRQYDYFSSTEGDRWAWVSDATSGGGARPCHLNLNFNQPGAVLGEWDCQIEATASNPVIGGLCCK